MAAVGPVEYALLCIWEAACQPRLPLSVRNKIPGIVRITQTWAAMAEPPPAGFRLPGSHGYHWTTQVVPSGIKLVCWGPGHTCGVFNCHAIVEFTFSQLSPWSSLTQLAAASFLMVPAQPAEGPQEKSTGEKLSLELVLQNHGR